LVKEVSSLISHASKHVHKQKPADNHKETTECYPSKVIHVTYLFEPSFTLEMLNKSKDLFGRSEMSILRSWSPK